ncbi:MAG: exo-alpha-sialidase [Sporichthyaceae bacterium]|nr:exo-alpha-sialidase [Sporichthyaceae bacterium]
MSRRRRQTIVGSSIATLVATASLVAVNLTGAPGGLSAPAGDGEMPGALGSRLEQLRQAVPGQQGMDPEGPGSAEDEEFLQRAYPKEQISIAQMDRAKASFLAAEARVAPGTEAAVDGAAARVWTQAGPSRALYPFTKFRDAFNYVPNEYVAGGRTTSITLSNVCKPLNCRAWITAAGGGVWSTVDALAAEPSWAYLGGPFGINAAGDVSVDNNDPTGKTVYVGTGEANICGSGCVAGVGLYRSTDGGFTWTGPLGKKELGGKGIGEIVVKPGDPKTLYVATTTALRGMSSVCCSGVTRPVPDAAPWGLYKSTDGGASWKLIHNGSANIAKCTGDDVEFLNGSTCSPRGVRQVELDPNNSNIVYASSYARGVWRSSDAGSTWTQIKPSINAAIIQSRPAFDVTKLPNGKTRMYVHEGNFGDPYSRLFRSDDVATGLPVFKDLSSANVADPGFATYNLCGGQCWYDIFVTTPDGYPDIVYVGGSYSYDETIANKRAVILSTDAGVSGTDMTFDGTDILHPNGLHPDQHDLVTNPNNPYQFFETNDGGVMRSSGSFVDRSFWCDDPRRNLTDPAEKARCEQMLSKIPSKLTGINTGLSTLQFMSLSVSPHEPDMLQGGTQDNGTWENKGETTTWVNTMIGDGGQSGFDAKRPEFRFHNFYNASPEVNFDNGDIADWIWTADPIFGQPGTQFYAPVISDPVVSGTMFAGTGVTAYRTTTFGLGNRTMAEAQRVCNTWTGTFEAQCGDWRPLGRNPLVDAFWGDREGGAVAAIERTSANTGWAWAATTTGRLFITRNVDARNPANVEWIRIDDDDAMAPNRFVSSIYPHPTLRNRAVVSYSGFSSNTPDTPGHVFAIRYHKSTGTSSWRNLSTDFGDQPVTDLVRDGATQDLFASTDFGVLKQAAASNTWVDAAKGMPNVEVTGLTFDPNRRILYAASHGLSAWELALVST